MMPIGAKAKAGEAAARGRGPHPPRVPAYAASGFCHRSVGEQQQQPPPKWPGQLRRRRRRRLRDCVSAPRLGDDGDAEEERQHHGLRRSSRSHRSS